MSEHRNARLAGIGTLVVIIIVVALAFILGGQHSASDGSSAGVASAPGEPAGKAPEGSSALSRVQGGAAKAIARPEAAASAPPGLAVQSAAGSAGAQGQIESADDSVAATRVVKTGSLELRVARGQVQATVSELVSLTTGLNGYVSRSHTDSVDGSPDGDVTLRIPAGRFDNAVTAAERLGKVTSLTTNAHDVTGQYVDLGARLSALQQTRSTYLTILGRATTIGSTLEVQQRVNDVQQQIEELQGQLKVLRNQSADGTLTVDVSQTGVLTPVRHHHKPNGIGAAWHRSINRFARGFDAIVGALGPLLLALMILAVFAAIAALGYRGIRRATGYGATPTHTT
jgi:hypothetical protein